MKTIVLYYSLQGSTRRAAEEEARKRGADLLEIKEAAPRSVASAYLKGCYQALNHKTVPLEPEIPSLISYDNIILMAPVWAGYPAPPFNNMIEALPVGKNVEVILLSLSGGSRCRSKVEEQVHSQGCKLAAFIDRKSQRST